MTGTTRLDVGYEIVEDVASPDPAAVRHTRTELRSQAIQVPVRAGDAFVFSGHLLHSGVTNRSSAARPSVQAFYVRRGLEHYLGVGGDAATNATVDRLGDHLHLLL